MDFLSGKSEQKISIQATYTPIKPRETGRLRYQHHTRPGATNRQQIPAAAVLYFTNTENLRN